LEEKPADANCSEFVDVAQFHRRALCLGLIIAAPSTPVAAAKTLAGTVISNTAQATYSLPNGGSGSLDSNTVTLKVDEVLDVAVAPLSSSDVTVTPGATNQVLAFKITNAGNGQESFKLAARGDLTGDDFDPSTTSIVIDSNGNDTYDPGTDTIYVAGSNEPVLAPDAGVTVFVLSTIPAGATDGQRGQGQLSATAATGSGPAGTLFAGQGEGGSDAIAGLTTASAAAGGFYAVSAASVTLTKSATVADPFGGSSHVPGAIITYKLVATVSGSGSLSNLAVTDTVPSGTTYQAGSLALGGSSLTDAADGDSGEVVSGNLEVRLGTAAAGSTSTIIFKVKVD
jgi:uncharacterized repeat protein (TIGR01451 family)